VREPPPFDDDWLRGKREGLLVRVETLKKGQRFVDCYGALLKYEKVDGAGPGATHHSRTFAGGLHLLAGWTEVLVEEPCPNHPWIVGWRWQACPVCENST
jgi:hypothetical protein